MQVYVLIGNEGVWEGTIIDVSEETDTHYIGLASHGPLTYTATMEKKYCIEYPEGMGFMERLFWSSDQKKIRRRELKIDDVLE